MIVRSHSGRAPRRRALLPAALLLAASVGLAACGGGDGGSSKPDPNAKVTLTWWTGQSADAEKTLEGLAREFEKLHSNMKIDVSSGASVTDDLLQKLSAGFASNQYPDISYAFGSWASELAGSGRTLDLTEQVKDPALGWDEFPEAGRLTATPQGKTIGFPAIVDNLTLLYNKTVFDKAGVAYPTNDWSWDDYRAAAKKLTDPSTKTYGAAYSVSGSEDTTWHLWPLLWQKGGDVLSSDQKKAAFNSDAGVHALELLRAMAVDDKSMYLDQTDEKYGPLFAANRIGMIISGPWQLYDLNTAKTKYGVAYLPGFDGRHDTVAGPDLWVLFDHKDANRAHWAFEFTKWLTSAQQDAKWNLAQGNLPLRSSEKDSPAFQQMQQEYPGIDVMLANFENAKKPRPTVPGYVGLSEAVGSAISQVLQGAKEPKAALDEAAAKADKALAQD
ncbi:MAG: ABC transporter substrate-binding protein [Actinomycetes bacterium]